MVDIIILNPISSYKVNFNGRIFVLRPIFYLKTPLTKEIEMEEQLDEEQLSEDEEHNQPYVEHEEHKDH